jgi:hypothetical protein
MSMNALQLTPKGVEIGTSAMEPLLKMRCKTELVNETHLLLENCVKSYAKFQTFTDLFEDEYMFIIRNVIPVTADDLVACHEFINQKKHNIANTEKEMATGKTDSSKRGQSEELVQYPHIDFEYVDVLDDQFVHTNAGL